MARRPVTGLAVVVALAGTAGCGGGSGASQGAATVATRGASTDPEFQAAQARLHARRANAKVDVATSTYTPEGRRELRAAADAWRRYLALDPARPDPQLARLMLVVLGPGSLNRPAQAVQAAEIAAQSGSGPAGYAQFALLAYQAGQTRKGDLAAARAVALANPSVRASLRRQLAQGRALGSGGAGAR